MENLGYRLLPLWEENIISGALEDMDRAARQSLPESGSDAAWAADMCFRSFGAEVGRKMSDGKAVVGFEEQLTPAETPMVENVPGTKALSFETKEAFQPGGTKLEAQQFQLPGRSSLQEPFPTYVDPMLGRMGHGRG